MVNYGAFMILIAIVEDDILCKEDLRKNLNRYAEEKNIDFNVVEFSDGEEILDDYQGNYDLILMDIEMKFLDGMSTAKKIREFDKEVAIMFITNSSQYAINGYLVDALDYVLKPITYFTFAKRLDRVLSKINKFDEKFITVQTKEFVRKISLSELRYIEVQNHNLIFKTEDNTYITRGTLNEYEEELTKYNFFRCHRGYLVNIEKIDIYKGNEIEVGKEIIPVSRSVKKALMEKLNDFLNEV